MSPGLGWGSSPESFLTLTLMQTLLHHQMQMVLYQNSCSPLAPPPSSGSPALPSQHRLTTLASPEYPPSLNSPYWKPHRSAWPQPDFKGLYTIPFSSVTCRSDFSSSGNLSSRVQSGNVSSTTTWSKGWYFPWKEQLSQSGDQQSSHRASTQKEEEKTGSLHRKSLY